MSDTKIEPHKVQNPIQLLAVWFAALVLLDGAFLAAAATVKTPAWVAPMLAIAAIVFVPTFLVLAFVMQTKFRTHLQDDDHFADWLKSREKQFADFQPENSGFRNQEDVVKSVSTDQVNGAPEDRRIKEYERNRGLFLLHDWVPSRGRGQIADIMIWLHQHRNGPMSDSRITKVEYHLGRNFFNGKPAVKTNAGDAFRLEISAYGPVLCLARVFIEGDDEPVELFRYIDFEVTPEKSAAHGRGTAGTAPGY
jgi:hypothetical protein